MNDPIGQVEGRRPRLGVVIPALDEEASVGRVVDRVLRAVEPLGEVRVVVADNGSRDRTARVAAGAGAEVVKVPRRGYGLACLGAVGALGGWPDFLIFLDADGSSAPEEMGLVAGPLISGEAEAVLGFRTSSAAMTAPQKWGTRLAVLLVNLAWGTRYRDMGPFRGLGREVYRRLGMADETWGWTIEMQIRLREEGVRVLEVPVSWNQRLAGRSKISGNLLGVARAGGKILWTVARFALSRRRRFQKSGSSRSSSSR